jgi:hypothetical protein
MTAAVVLLILVSAIFRGSAVLGLFIPLVLNYLWLLIVGKIPLLKPFYLTGMALTLSLTTLWLYSVVAPRRHPIIRIITALIIFALFGIATYYSIGINDYLYRNILFPYYFLLSIAIIAGLVFSGIRCRKRFTNRRFILSLLIGIYIFNLLALTGVTIYYGMKYTGFSSSYRLILPVFLGGSLLATVFPFLLILPYILITFRNALFRTAMMSVFGLTKNMAINDDLKNECEKR